MRTVELAQAKEILRATISARDEGHIIAMKLRSIAALLEKQGEEHGGELNGVGMILGELTDQLCEVLHTFETLTD